MNTEKLKEDLRQKQSQRNSSLTFQGLLGGFDLAKPGLMRLEKESIHVGEFHFVVIEENQFSDAASGQHFSCHTSDATDANHSNARKRKGWMRTKKKEKDDKQEKKE